MGRLTLLGAGLPSSVAMAALSAVGGYGLSMAALDNSIAIVDQSTPANNFQGTPDAKLTTTRASAAMYWDADGLLKSAATGTLRRDFDPRLASTPERCGYLIEGARTNLALRSEEFSNASWTKTNTTVTADQATAPDGALTMDAVRASSTSATLKRVTQDVTVVNATGYTQSVFAKAGTDSYVVFRFDASNYVSFNLSTLAVGTTGTYFSSPIITHVGGGIYLCTARFTSTSTTHTIWIGPDVANTTHASTATDIFYLWGAQVELGSFASSYIPTAGSTVTCAADLVTLAGTLFPLNQSEGTLYAKFASMGVAATSVWALTLDNGTAAETMTIGRNTNRTALAAVFDGTVHQIGSSGISSTATVADNTQTKSALGYKLNDTAVAQAGETVQIDIVCTMPTTTQMVFGNRALDSARALNGWLFEAMYLPTRLTDVQLAALAA